MDISIHFVTFFEPQTYFAYATPGVPQLVYRLLFTTLYVA